MQDGPTIHTRPPPAFDPAAFLASAGLGRRIVKIKAKGIFFSQGSPADHVFYLQAGRAKLTVVSGKGKEGTSRFLPPATLSAKNRSPPSRVCICRAPSRSQAASP